MAITSSAGDGVRVTTSAKNNGVIQDAAGLPANQFVLPDGIVATNNGQIGLSTLAGRLITIRRNEVNEETRYILSEHGLETGTVNENFEFPPTGGMAYDIAYVIEDAATLTGFSLITKRTRDYSLGREFTVGNDPTGTFGWYALLDGASMESYDKMGATDREFQIEGDGRWDFGYEQGGAPVPGGYLIGTDQDAADWALEIIAGGQLVANQMFLTCVQNLSWDALNDSRITVNGLQLFSAAYQSIFESNGIWKNVVHQGKGTSNDWAEIDESFESDGFLLINTYGFYPNGVTTGTVRGYQSVGNVYDIQMLSEGTLVRFINPLWDGLNPKPSWTASTGTFEERFDYNTDFRTPEGSPIVGAVLYLYDDFDGDFQVQAVSDATGTYDTTALARSWASGTAGGAPTQVRGSFVTRALNFSNSPFESTVVIDEPINQVLTLVDDVGVEISEASADGVSYNVYEHGTGTAPGNLIAFDNGTIAFVEGDIVVGVSSGATGTVADISGDTSAGTLFIKNRNGSAFTDGEDLQVGGVKNAEAGYLMSGTFLDYHWEWWADTEALDDSYAAQSSRTAKASPDAWVLSMLKHRTQLFQRSGGDFWTEDVDSEGVYISERGAGNILYLTADNGWRWTPPQQFTLTLTGIVTGSGGSEVRIYERIGVNETGAELAGIETADVTFQYSYEHGGSDIPTIIVVFHNDYAPIWQHYDLTAADASLPVQQTFDRVYSNP